MPKSMRDVHQQQLPLTRYQRFTCRCASISTNSTSRGGNLDTPLLKYVYFKYTNLGTTFTWCYNFVSWASPLLHREGRVWWTRLYRRSASCIPIRLPKLQKLYTLITTWRKAVSMMLVMMDLDQELSPLNSKLWCFLLFNTITPWIIDVDVINGYRHRRGGGGGAITLHQRAQW